MKKCITLVVALITICSFQAAAIERRSLEVTCQLAEHRYLLNLTAAQISQIETSCANEISSLLNKKIGFLDIVAGVNQDNKLQIKIGKTSAEADPGAFRAVNFEIEIQGENVIELGDQTIWEFRSVDEYFDVPSADTFADAIAVGFKENLEIHEEQLVEEQLGRLVIAGSAFPIPQEQSWLLPFSREELGIADDSKFKIKAALAFPNSEEHFVYYVILFGDFDTATGVPSEFHHKVKALHLRDDKLEQEPSLQRLTRADNVKVEYVLISRYVPIVRPERTSPSGLASSQAGGVQ
jgi:hypothetical protein